VWLQYGMAVLGLGVVAAAGYFRMQVVHVWEELAEAQVGHNPIPPYRPVVVDRETFHLGRAREAYARGAISLERFEALADHVLAGGYLSHRLEPRSTPEPGTLEHAQQAVQHAFGPPGAIKSATPTYGLR